MSSKTTERQGILFCLCGPAGGGKTTLADKLIASHSGTITRSISVTSRKPREGEKNGESYHFVAREEFKSRIDRGEFFEWEEIHGNLYGTLKSTVKQALDSGIDLLLVIDVRGVITVKNNFPSETIAAFVVPPSYLILKDRLIKRLGSNTSDVTIRLETAREEYKVLFEELPKGIHSAINYFVLNDVFEDAYGKLEAILQAERTRMRRFSVEKIKEICTVEAG